MDDIHLRICDHIDDLRTLADALEVDRATVHLVAVLVLSGLDDADVTHQLAHLHGADRRQHASAWSGRLIGSVRSLLEPDIVEPPH